MSKSFQSSYFWYFLFLCVKPSTAPHYLLNKSQISSLVIGETSYLPFTVLPQGFSMYLCRMDHCLEHRSVLAPRLFLCPGIPPPITTHHSASILPPLGFFQQCLPSSISSSLLATCVSTPKLAQHLLVFIFDAHSSLDFIRGIW